MIARAIAVFLTGLLSVAGTARAAVFDPEVFELSNGMQVVVISNHRAPVVSHMVFYKVGAADEPPGKSGIAHFLEHLMFKATDEIPAGEFSKIIDSLGGSDNAFTSWDYTGYYQNVPRDKLETVMAMEADRMVDLELTDDVVLPERNVVLEERSQVVDNSPARQFGEQMRAALFQNHAYGIPIIGWEAEIEALTTADALDFYRRYYMPNNAILLVSGDITADELRPLAEAHYGAIPAGEVPPRVRPAEPEHRAARTVVMTDPRVGQARWSRDYLAPSYNRGDTAHAYALQILAEILGGGTTSRMYRALVVEAAIATSAGAGYDPMTFDLTPFRVHAMPRQGVEVEALAAAVDEQIALILADGVTAAEVDGAKARMRAAAIYARDSLSFGPRVIGMALTTGGSVDAVEAWPERMEAVTPADVLAAARAVFDERRSVTGILLPEEQAGG